MDALVDLSRPFKGKGGSYYAVGTVIGGLYAGVKPVNRDGSGRHAVIRGYNNGANDARRYQPPGKISAKGSLLDPLLRPRLTKE